MGDSHTHETVIPRAKATVVPAPDDRVIGSLDLKSVANVAIIVMVVVYTVYVIHLIYKDRTATDPFAGMMDELHKWQDQAKKVELLVVNADDGRREET